MPISRHGINRLQDTRPLARASFEEVADQLFEAAAYGDVDPCHDVSSHIMLGQRVRVGTGIVDVVDDADACELLDAEGEDVIFSGVGVGDDDEPMSCAHAGRPVEMPYCTAAVGGHGVSALHSFLASLPPVARTAYAPSSPKDLGRPRGRKRNRGDSPQLGSGSEDGDAGLGFPRGAGL